MVYRFELKRSPRSLLLPVIAVALVGGSLAVAILVQPLIGVIALAVSGYVSYHLIKFFIHTIHSHVRTSDEGMVCVTSTGSEVRMKWHELTHAGWFHQGDAPGQLFVYAEGNDELVTLPNQYESLSDLADEVREHAELMELHAAADVEIGDALRDTLFPDLRDEESETTEEDDTPGDPPTDSTPTEESSQ